MGLRFVPFVPCQLIWTIYLLLFSHLAFEYLSDCHSMIFFFFYFYFFFEVLEAAIRWLSHDAPARHPHIESVLSHVRFPLIPSKLLKESINSTSDGVLKVRRNNRPSLYYRGKQNIIYFDIIININKILFILQNIIYICIDLYFPANSYFMAEK